VGDVPLSAFPSPLATCIVNPLYARPVFLSLLFPVRVAFGSVRISASPPQRAAGTRLDPGRLEGRPAGGVGRRRSGECAVGVPSGRGTRAERSVERDSVYMYTRPSSLALGHKPTWLLCGGAAPCTASPPKALPIEKAVAFVTRRWMRPLRRPCRCHRRACRARIQYACP
jgi:hypothetical protein